MHRNCTDHQYSFGTVSMKLYRSCTDGQYSFGTCSMKLNRNCTDGQHQFGTVSMKLYWCRLYWSCIRMYCHASLKWYCCQVDVILLSLVRLLALSEQCVTHIVMSIVFWMHLNVSNSHMSYRHHFPAPPYVLSIPIHRIDINYTSTVRTSTMSSTGRLMQPAHRGRQPHERIDHLSPI